MHGVFWITCLTEMMTRKVGRRKNLTGFGEHAGFISIGCQEHGPKSYVSRAYAQCLPRLPLSLVSLPSVYRLNTFTLIVYNEDTVDFHLDFQHPHGNEKKEKA
jgi:hypothetical protein